MSIFSVGYPQSGTSGVKSSGPRNACREISDPTSSKLFIEACGTGYLQRIEMYLAMGGNINAAGPHGWTGLTKAAANGQVDVLRFLFSSGADPEMTGYKDRTPLSSALLCGRCEAALVLLACGANPDSVGSSGSHPLHLAIDNQIASAALLAAGANPDCLDSAGRTPLMEAAACGNSRSVKLLLDAGADVRMPDACGRTALMRALENGYLVSAHMLITAGSSVSVADAQGRTPLCLALTSTPRERPPPEYPPIVDRLLGMGTGGIAGQDRGLTVLRIAVKKGLCSVVRLILDLEDVCVLEAAEAKKLIKEAGGTPIDREKIARYLTIAYLTPPPVWYSASVWHGECIEM